MGPHRPVGVLGTAEQGAAGAPPRAVQGPPPLRRTGRLCSQGCCSSNLPPGLERLVKGTASPPWPAQMHPRPCCSAQLDRWGLKLRHPAPLCELRFARQAALQAPTPKPPRAPAMSPKPRSYSLKKTPHPLVSGPMAHGTQTPRSCHAAGRSTPVIAGADGRAQRLRPPCFPGPRGASPARAFS